MADKIVRVKIRLNRMTILALKEFKRLKYGDSSVPVSDSYIVSEAYRIILDKIGNIDWSRVNSARINNITDSVDAPSSTMPTTLSINDDVELGLREIQKKLMKKSNGRVFFSYVIKIVLFAAVLELDDKLNNFLI